MGITLEQVKKTAASVNEVMLFELAIPNIWHIKNKISVSLVSSLLK